MFTIDMAQLKLLIMEPDTSQISHFTPQFSSSKKDHCFRPIQEVLIEVLITHVMQPQDWLTSLDFRDA